MHCIKDRYNDMKYNPYQFEVNNLTISKEFAVVLLLSYVWLFWEPMGCCLPSSSVHGIHQAGILEWVDMPSSRGFSQPRNWNQVSYLLQWQAASLPLAPPGKPCVWGELGNLYFQLKWGEVKSLSRGPTLCDPCIFSWII